MALEIVPEMVDELIVLVTSENLVVHLIELLDKMRSELFTLNKLIGELFLKVELLGNHSTLRLTHIRDFVELLYVLVFGIVVDTSKLLVQLLDHLRRERNGVGQLNRELGIYTKPFRDHQAERRGHSLDLLGHGHELLDDLGVLGVSNHASILLVEPCDQVIRQFVGIDKLQCKLGIKVKLLGKHLTNCRRQVFDPIDLLFAKLWYRSLAFSNVFWSPVNDIDDDLAALAFQEDGIQLVELGDQLGSQFLEFEKLLVEFFAHYREGCHECLSLLVAESFDIQEFLGVESRDWLVGVNLLEILPALLLLLLLGLLFARCSRLNTPLAQATGMAMDEFVFYFIAIFFFMILLVQYTFVPNR
ncbi:hypothetical protein HG531_008799 [Fusarium graminearum]|nr:hypothetical protein HG531_008799 [Fusarium graminearum]